MMKKQKSLPTDRGGKNFENENGETLSSERVVKGEKPTMPEEPYCESEEGYEITFVGWSNGETEWNFDTDTVTENVTLTARFDRVAIEYDCTFTDADGNVTNVSYTVENADIVLAGLKEKLHESDEKNVYTNNLPESLPLESGKAYYETRNAVTFAVKIGEEETTIPYGEKIAKPADPAISPEKGYEITFIGWFNGETEWDFDTDIVTENVTLTAKFNKTAIEYTVTFVAEGKTVAAEKYTIENLSVIAPAVPEKEGYTGKWEKYELNCENITVNAVYTKNEPETPPQPDNPNPDQPDKPDNPDKPDDSGKTEEQKGGCKSAFGGYGAISALCLAAATVLICRKKKIR